ncbi:MAG: type II CAAX endopeptidase family protein [Pseudomonadota bacterium]
MAQPFIVPFETFVAPARARAEIWRTLAGICVAAIISVVTLTAFLNLLGDAGIGIDPDGGDPFSMLIILATFVGMAMGPMAAVALLHRRGLRTLLGPLPWALRDFIVAAGVVTLVYAASLVVWSMQYDALPGIDFGLWITVLPLALLGVLIQTGAEELVFRGYLQQQLAARFASPIAWAIVPSALFAWGHYDETAMGQNALLFVLATGIFGLIAADLTARTGSIGAAWGMHFANNVYAVLIVSAQGPLSGLALYQTPYTIRAPEIAWLVVVDAITLLIAWGLIRRLLSR